MAIDGRLFDQCSILEMKPYIMRILLPDGIHECSGRIFGDEEILTVRNRETLQPKQSMTLKLNNPQRQEISDKFFELAIKKYPKQLRHKTNMARDEAFRRGTVNRARKGW